MTDKNEYYTNLFIKNPAKIKIRILCSSTLFNPGDKDNKSDDD